MINDLLKLRPKLSLNFNSHIFSAFLTKKLQEVFIFAQATCFQYFLDWSWVRIHLIHINRAHSFW